MSHILITGGTGMLKDVTLYFTQHSYTVSVIARDQSGFDELINEKTAKGFINPVKVDYKNYERLTEKIKSAIDFYGAIDICINWIHSDAQEAPYIIADILNDQNIKCKYFHVLGCEFSNPDLQNTEIEKTFERFVNILYRKIILGFVIEDETSRWLSNKEISNGVIDAFNYEKDSFTIGKTEPWEMKP